MGTVGISFGSPTSGTGFNVSDTVSSIVANLQKVETPWKSQLTTLQSQDTAISSLGTLLSNLSNDLSGLTNFTGVMAQKTGSSSDSNVVQLTSATASATAGTHTIQVQNLAATSSGYLAEIPSATTALLVGSHITLQVGSGATKTITLNSTNNTLSGLAAAINLSGVGVTASVLTDSTGSRLSLVSGSSGAAGNIAITNNNLQTADGLTSLGYTNAVTGVDATVNIDGITGLKTSSNIVSNLIPGITFQLLSTSPTLSGGGLTPVQVVIGNSNTSVESTVAQMVTDYNSLISAVHAQEGTNSSGTPQPLFGSPTLSLLQSQLMQSLNAQNPSGNLTTIPSGPGTTFTGDVTIQKAGGTAVTYHMANATTPNTSTDIYISGNTLTDLQNAINAGAQNTSVGYTSTGVSDGTVTVSNTANLAGALSIQVGSGSPTTINVPTSGDMTVNGLAAAINSAGISGLTANVTTNGSGVATLSLAASGGQALNVTSNVYIPGVGYTAGVVTKNGQSTLDLQSQTAGTNGALSVTTSNLVATTQPALTYTGFLATSSTNSNGSLTAVSNASAALSGEVDIQVGSGALQKIKMSDVQTAQGGTTLNDLKQYINAGSYGVTAALSSDGKTLSFTSNTAGTGGNLVVNSTLLDTTDLMTTNMDYIPSSNLSGLANIGVTVSSNYDGSLQFDAATLDSALNSDYNGVIGFFQGLNSWGQTFSTMLTNAGSSSSTGTLKLAAKSNSTQESNLNATISREESIISVQQKSLTAELNSANQILQSIPTQLTTVNEIYSAISGYNTKQG